MFLAVLHSSGIAPVLKRGCQLIAAFLVAAFTWVITRQNSNPDLFPEVWSRGSCLRQKHDNRALVMMAKMPAPLLDVPSHDIPLCRVRLCQDAMCVKVEHDVLDLLAQATLI
jgi:hypothetical protein